MLCNFNKFVFIPSMCDGILLYILITIFKQNLLLSKFQIPHFVKMQAHFKILNYMRRDMIDSIEGLTSPDLTLAMDSKIPVSIKMFTAQLPLSVIAFNELVRKCANGSTVFNLFTGRSDTITCRL